MHGVRVLLLSEYYWPDEASTGRFLADLTSQLKRDHPEMELAVLTSTRVYRAPLKEVLPRREQWNGIQITRLRSFRSGNDSFLRRAVSDLLFSLQVLAWLLPARCDVVFVVTNPPLMAMMVGLIKRLKRKPVLYLIADLYPDLPVAIGLWQPHSPFVRALRWLQHTALEGSTRIIVLGRCMRDRLVQAYGANPNKISVIPSWFTVTHRGGAGRPRSPAGPFNVVYSGNLGQYQDFETVLAGAELLRPHESIKIHIVGDGVRAGWIRQEVVRRALPNVVLSAHLPDSEFRELLYFASLGIVTLEPNMEGISVPSKIYNLLATGVPLLAVLGKQSEVARLIAEHGVGYQVDHGDAAGFASAVLDAYRNPQKRIEMAERARAYALSKASLEVVARQYADELFRIAQMARSGVRA